MDPLELTQQGFDAFNNRTLRDMADLVDPNIVTVDAPLSLEMQGRDAYFDYNDGFVTAVPDIQGTIVSSEVDGNVVRITARGQGTFTGQLETPEGVVPGNGNPVNIKYHGEWEYSDDGKLVRFSVNYDMQEYMSQFGMG